MTRAADDDTPELGAALVTARRDRPMLRLEAAQALSRDVAGDLGIEGGA